MSTFDDTFTESVQALQAWLDFLNNMEQALRDKMTRMQQSAAAKPPADKDTASADAFRTTQPVEKPVHAAPPKQGAAPIQSAPPSAPNAAPSADDDDPWL